MSNDFAIKVNNLSKVYKLYNSPVDRLKEALHPLRRQYHHDFYALNDVSFHINKGESVGIVGKNGSGKSTLLKILTGVLTPTSGTVQVNGKVSALLELGAGFNPELTGVENVYFNGMLMGYSRDELDERLDDILSFADIGEFVHQPVKMYSSGMFVRLAFAVAVNVEPEILIIDEALSVGDAVFQAKCFKKMNELMAKTTVVFVTHDMTTVQSICNKVFVLNNGALNFTGPPAEATVLYYKLCREFDIPSVVNKSQAECHDAEISQVKFFNHAGIESSELESGKNFSVNLTVKINKIIDNLAVGVLFRNIYGMRLLGMHSYHHCRYKFGERLKDEVLNISFRSDMLLAPGEYLVSAGIADQKSDTDYRNIYMSNDFCSVKVYGNVNTYGSIVNKSVEIDVN